MQLHFTPRESEKLLATRSKILLNPGTSAPGLLQVAVKICFALYQTGRKQVEICILTLETTGKVFLPLFFFFFSFIPSANRSFPAHHSLDISEGGI